MKTIIIAVVALAGLGLAVLLSNANEKQRTDVQLQADRTGSSELSNLNEKQAMDVSLTAEEIALARGLKAAPPWGNPGRYAPGPERDLVELKMWLWGQERMKAVLERQAATDPTAAEIRERRRIWANATRIDEEVPGSGRKPVPYVLDEDLPPEERKRFLEELPMIAQREQEHRASLGPSKILRSIVADAVPEHLLNEVYSLLLEISFEIPLPPEAKAQGFGTEQHRIAYIQHACQQMGFNLTDDQIRKLIAVKPVQRLWTKD
jgi:hypothetical protein